MSDNIIQAITYFKTISKRKSSVDGILGNPEIPTPLSDLLQTPKRPTKSIGNDVPHSLMCFQENFIKEMDTMKNFNKVAEKKFEHLANDFVILSRKNPASRRDDSKLAIELLKNKVLTLENQLTEKDALINVLYRKVDIAKNAFIKIDQVRFSESSTEMIISNNNNNNDNSNATVLNKSSRRIFYLLQDLHSPR